MPRGQATWLTPKGCILSSYAFRSSTILLCISLPAVTACREDEEALPTTTDAPSTDESASCGERLHETPAPLEKARFGEMLGSQPAYIVGLSGEDLHIWTGSEWLLESLPALGVPQNLFPVEQLHLTSTSVRLQGGGLAYWWDGVALQTATVLAGDWWVEEGGSSLFAAHLGSPLSEAGSLLSDAGSGTWEPVPTASIPVDGALLAVAAEDDNLLVAIERAGGDSVTLLEWFDGEWFEVADLPPSDVRDIDYSAHRGIVVALAGGNGQPDSVWRRSSSASPMEDWGYTGPPLLAVGSIWYADVGFTEDLELVSLPSSTSLADGHDGASDYGFGADAYVVLPEGIWTWGCSE